MDSKKKCEAIRDSLINMLYENKDFASASESKMKLIATKVAVCDKMLDCLKKVSILESEDRPIGIEDGKLSEDIKKAVSMVAYHRRDH